MKVLILGAKGMLGSELVRIFTDDEIYAWDKEELDISRGEEVKNKISALLPDLIINAAAYNAVDRAEEEKELAALINGYAVGFLAEASLRRGAILIHYSTDFVFDGASRDGYKEDDRPTPLSAYGQSKYLGEKLLQEKTNKFYLIRLAALFGKAGTSAESKKSFIEARLKDGQTKAELFVVNDEFTSPTYAPDLARLTREIIRQRLPFGIYHGTNSGVCSWYELTKKIFELVGIKTKVTPISGDKLERKARRPKYPILLNTKLPPARHFEEALKEYLWEKDQIPNSPNV